MILISLILWLSTWINATVFLYPLSPTIMHDSSKFQLGKICGAYHVNFHAALPAPIYKCVFAVTPVVDFLYLCYGKITFCTLVISRNSKIYPYS